MPAGSELLWNESQVRLSIVVGAADETQAWIHVGRFLWYKPEIEQAATDALYALLNVPVGDPLPPLITVHLRSVRARGSSD